MINCDNFDACMPSGFGGVNTDRIALDILDKVDLKFTTNMTRNCILNGLTLAITRLALANRDNSEAFKSKMNDDEDDSIVLS